MPNSPDSIDDILGRGGSLARALDGFEYRASQVEMAGVIEEALVDRVPAIIEAGTGTGKTLGYLVPLVLSHKKTVISTGTKNLQEQVYFKDIPILSNATGLKIDAVLMKGRQNYLCLHRYHQYFSHLSFLELDREKTRERLEIWLKKTEFADRAELSWLADDDPFWDNLSSSSDQCLGSECIHQEKCFLNALRRRAARAGIIIVNHHLFFADIMVKRRGFGEIIPRFQVAVFDEAHNLEEIATTYLGESLSTNQLMELVGDTEKEIKETGKTRGLELRNWLNTIRAGAETLRSLFDPVADRGHLDEKTLFMIHQGPAHDIRDGLKALKKHSDPDGKKGGPLQAVANRAALLEESFEKILAFEDPNWLTWYEKRKRGVILHASPLDISDSLNDLIFNKVKTVIFTSATLSTNGNFDYVRSRLGIPGIALECLAPSHFTFDRQTLMYVPKDLPVPGNPGFALKAAERISDILTITSGRALILFTSYANLNLVHRLLAGKIPFAVYRQGDAPRSLLLERFRNDTHSVLLATGSFWQGVDVPGETLSCLIIDKLPFGSPGDPLVAGRIESIRTRGGNPFMEYQLPSAIISLKQGLGRLIRKSSDRGILAVLDKRLITSRYGRFFFQSLPGIPVSHELSRIQEFFRK